MVVFRQRAKKQERIFVRPDEKPSSNDRAAAKYGRNIKASKKHYFGGT